MTTVALAPDIEPLDRTGRRSASPGVGPSAPVVNMGLEEIQKQAKAG